MKGNVMIRLISLMILIPAAAAHFTGQIDLTEPTWLWLTIFAGLNAFQSSFTGWCPACKVQGVCNSGTCSIPKTNNTNTTSNTSSSCCSSDKANTDSSCCSEEPKQEKASCSDDCLDIKVLGADTQYSKATSALIEETAKEMDVLCCITRVEETNEITKQGFEVTSGVIINTQVVHTGAVPTKAQVTGWLQKTDESASPSGCCGSCS